jgi:hypothetical protein
MSWDNPDSEARQVKPFAVNINSESEGMIATRENIEIGREEVSGRSGEASMYTPLWPYALGLCLALLMVEWWVYHRKTYI